MQGFRLEVGDNPLAFYDFVTGGAPYSGDQPCLVLGHALGVDHRMWLPTLEVLPPGIRVILWDLPGHGQSSLLDLDGWDGQAQPASLNVVAQFLHAGLATLQPSVSAPVVGGLSMGGMVSLAFAQLYPNSLSELVMFSSGAVLLPHEAWFDRATAVDRQGLAPLVDATMERWFSEQFASGPGRVSVAKIRDIFMQTDPAGYAQCARLLGGSDLRPQLADVKVPALLVAGEDDPGAPPSQVRHVAEQIAGSRVEVIPGVRHLSAVEKPTLAAGALVSAL